MSVEDHLKLAREQRKEYLAIGSDMTVSTLVAQSKAQGKAKDIQAAMKKIE